MLDATNGVRINHFLLDVCAGFVACCFVQLWERVAKAVAEVGRAAILLLEYRVFDDGCPGGAMLLVSGLQRPVFLDSKWSPPFTSRLLEEIRPVWERRAYFAG